MTQKRHQPNRAGRNTAKAIKMRPYLFHNAVVTYYLLLMFSFFTLFLTKKYSNARHDKFYLFLILSGALIIFAGMAYFSAWMEKNRVGAALDPLIKPISVTDGAFLCFVIFALISTFCSRYFPETIIAEVGRNNGLLLLVAYLLVYFTISRLYVYKDYAIAVYLVFSCVVALLTVINFFYIDPLGLFERYGEDVVKDFGSTIGNKNTIASYMAMFLPVSIMVLALSEKKYMRIIAGISIVFAYTGALCANSGSVMMGLAVVIPVTAIFCAQRYERIMRFMLALTILFAGGKLLWLFSLLMDGHSKGFESIQHFLIYDNLSWLPVAVCGLIALALFLLRGRLSPKYPAKAVTIVLIALTGAMVAGMLGVLFWFSVIDTKSDLGSLDTLLRFSDRWGTHRGFMWNKAVEEYGKFNLYEKLFGAGPDTAYYVLEPHFSELYTRFNNSSTDCVHNEYLNYLVTQGALGLISYLTILVSVCVRTSRRARNNPTALIFISAVICYAVQATVNIYQPITTPLFLIFIAMAEALNRQTPPYKAK